MFISIVSLLVVLTLSILVTRIATVALTHTGLSRESARFQARSAFTGVGFTTTESEKVVGHPVRRRVLLLLMLLGNAGIVTAISSLLLTFLNIEGARSVIWPVALLVAGVVALWAIAHSKWVDRHLSNLISWALARYTDLEVQDYAGLLHLAGEYQVTELTVEPEDWLADQTLADLRLRDEGVLVLGITRVDGTFLGAPEGHTKVLANDVLILYGRASNIESLDQRRKNRRGEREHEKAVEAQQEIVEQETREDPAQGGTD